MSPNPIRKVLSTFLKCDVKALLMGGQACILYGAAEFSRDTDFAVLCSAGNLEKLKRAFRGLRAEPVFLPPLEARFLKRGHACHFRCRHPEAAGLRVDVMSAMRGCEPFPALWRRRTLVDLSGLAGVPLLSLPDLIRAKKTQRDKDWPMIRRLVEAHYEENKESPSRDDVRFWLKESRTPAMLRRLAGGFPELATEVASVRPLLTQVRVAHEDEIEKALTAEEEAERALDRAYWEPLRRELEALREADRRRRRSESPGEY